MTPAISALKSSFLSGTAMHYHSHIDINYELVPLDYTSNLPFSTNLHPLYFINFLVINEVLCGCLLLNLY